MPKTSRKKPKQATKRKPRTAAPFIGDKIRPELRTLVVRIDMLHTHPQNVRQGDVGAISQSLEQHGQYRPIVFQQSSMRILAGNHTYMAARALGWTHIAATPVVCDDEQALRILVADNRANDLATYDDAEMTKLLAELAATDLGLAGTLYDTDDLDQMIADITRHIKLEATIDEVDDAAPAITKSGDIWLLGEHRLMCGDSIKLSDIETLLAGKTIGMAYLDPPYGISVVNTKGHTGISLPLGKAAAAKQRRGKVGITDVARAGSYRPIAGDQTTQVGLACYEIIKTIAPVIVMWGGNYFADKLPPSPCWIVWDRRRDVEVGSCFADCELAWTNLPSPARIYRQLWAGMVCEGEHDKRVHPTQKPVALAKWCIETYAPDGVVCDLFAGSGSTLLGAIAANRTAYLMELDAHYCDVICARYQKHTGAMPLLQATGKAHNFAPADTPPKKRASKKAAK